MLDTHLSFKTTPLSDDHIFVTLNAQTGISGQEFSTGIEMSRTDWNALQASAEDLAEMALECTRPISNDNRYMAQAYLASVLITPRYKEDGRTFDVAMFLTGGAMHDTACSVGMYHMDESSWAIATKMQAAMNKAKVWSDHIATGTGPDNRPAR